MLIFFRFLLVDSIECYVILTVLLTVVVELMLIETPPLETPPMTTFRLLGVSL